MKKMVRKYKKWKILSWIFCICFLGIRMPAHAGQVTEETGAVHAEYAYGAEKEPLADMEVRLYLAADMEQGGAGFFVAEELADAVPAIEPEQNYTATEWGAIAGRLAGKVQQDGIPALMAGLTDENGVVEFSDLPRGLYLLVAEGAEGYEISPILFSLPYYFEAEEGNGEWLDQVTVHAKVDFITPQVPGEPDDPDDPQPPGQPGQPEPQPEPQAQEEPMPQAEEEPELSEIDDEAVPLFAGDGKSWALANFLLMNLAVFLSVMLLVGYFVTTKEAEEEEKEEEGAETASRSRKPEEVTASQSSESKEPVKLKRKGLFRLLSLPVGVISVIAFVWTEDIKLPTTIFDKWTLLMLLFVLVQLVWVFFSRKKYVPEEEEDDQQEEGK